MSRRNGVQSDSLELLLDTICNMFGGIVFISLLVAVMLQASRRSPAENLKEVDAPDIELLEGSLEKSRLDLERLREAQAAQQKLVGGLIPGDVASKLAEWEELTAERADLERQAQALGKQNLGRVREVARGQRLVIDGKRRLDEAREELAELEKKQKTMVPRTSSPLPESVFRANVNQLQVSLCYDRFYIRHEYENGDRVGPNLEDYVVWEVGTNELRIHPKPTGGIPLDGSERSRAAILERLKGFSPAHWQVSAAVWPDSYDSFRMFREVVSQAGFRYQMLACDEDSEIVDRGGKPARSQ